MKKIIFIDNDNLEWAKKDLPYVIDALRKFGGIPVNELQDIEIIPDFHQLDKQSMYNILFGEKCVCSWSMYTATHFGSKDQLIRLLTAAGKNNVNGRVYIDTSSQLYKSLISIMRMDGVDHYAILNAIEMNDILSLDFDGEGFYRIRVELKGIFENPFKKQPINLYELLLLDIK